MCPGFSGAFFRKPLLRISNKGPAFVAIPFFPVRARQLSVDKSSIDEAHCALPRFHNQHTSSEPCPQKGRLRSDQGEHICQFTWVRKPEPSMPKYADVTESRCKRGQKPSWSSWMTLPWRASSVMHNVRQTMTSDRRLLKARFGGLFYFGAQKSGPRGGSA